VVKHNKVEYDKTSPKTTIKKSVVRHNKVEYDKTSPKTTIIRISRHNKVEYDKTGITILTIWSEYLRPRVGGGH